MKLEMDHDRAEQLLPWYANGALEADERRDVARHVAQCAACREELDFLGDVRAVVRVSAASEQPPPLARHAGFASLPADLQQRVLAKQRPALRKRHWMPALAAGFLAAVALGVVLTVTWLDAPRFRTATSGAAPGEEAARIVVGFEPGASLHEMNNLLREHDAVIVRAPDSRDHWLLEFPAAAGSDTDALLARLRAAPGVTLVQRADEHQETNE